MSVLAVLAFSDASASLRRKAVRWAVDLLFAEMPAAVPTDRPTLLRDAGIRAEPADPWSREAAMRRAVYRSHWLL